MFSVLWYQLHVRPYRGDRSLICGSPSGSFTLVEGRRGRGGHICAGCKETKTMTPDTSVLEQSSSCSVGNQRTSTTPTRTLSHICGESWKGLFTNSPSAPRQSWTGSTERSIVITMDPDRQQKAAADVVTRADLLHMPPSEKLITGPGVRAPEAPSLWGWRQILDYGGSPVESRHVSHGDHMTALHLNTFGAV